MKATWILIFFLVGQSTLSDCRHRPSGKIGISYRNRMRGGASGRSGCVGKLSLYQGQRLLGPIT